MVPNPFPYPLGVGIDVCKVSRLARLLHAQRLCNRWARRVFTRLEWPALWHQFQMTRSATRAATEKTDMTTSGVSAEERPCQMLDRVPTDSSILMLPEIPMSWSSMTGVENETLFYERSPVGLLARYVAGRWAAKEAVIKAHSNRRLYMRDISIISPRLHPGMFPVDFAKKTKVVALIDPQVNTILLDEHIAKVRALCGFGPQSQGFRKGALRTRQEHSMSMKEHTMGANVDTESTKYIQRRAKISESDRQMAEVSISHDGDTAVAMCLALDEQEPEITREIIIDDGCSLPIHEPNWGDEGWFSEMTFRIQA